jgi:uroporphyrinogen decarboxylase
MAAMIAEIKRVRRDVSIYFHSDGNVEAIIPDLIEVGVEILNPIQPECTDPAMVKRLYGDRITLWGTGSLQRTLPFGTEADVRQEVRDTIRACAANGGLVLMPSNVVGFDVPLKNLLAYYEEARSFDLKTL